MNSGIGVSDIVRNRVCNLLQCINKPLCAGRVEDVIAMALRAGIVVTCSRISIANDTLHALVIILIAPCENAIEFGFIRIHKGARIVSRCVEFSGEITCIYSSVVIMARRLAVCQEDDIRCLVCFLIGRKGIVNTVGFHQALFPVGTLCRRQPTDDILDGSRVCITGSAKIKICFTSSSEVGDGDFDNIRIQRGILR